MTSTKKIILSFICLLLFMSAQAQESLIIVGGQSKIEASPDLVRASVYLEHFAATYDEAVNALNQRTKSLSAELMKEGFKQEDIKTLSFNASPHYEYHEGRQVQKGFRASQSLEVEFPYVVDRLTKVVKRISAGSSAPNLNIAFVLSNAKQATLKKELLQLAMADSKAVAAILAETQGKTLDGFKEIRYGVNDPSPMPYMRADAMMLKSEAADFGGFQAKDITLSESVSVVWRVK